MVRNALLQHPDTAVRRMQDLETILSIRLVLGEDSQSGPADPDGAGVVESQPAQRSIIVYILNYKVENALLASCPCLGVVMVQGQPPESGLPAPCSSHRRSAFWFQSVSRLCHRGGIATSWFKLPECTCFTSFERFDFSCCLHFHSDIHSQVPFCLLALGSHLLQKPHHRCARCCENLCLTCGNDFQGIRFRVF